MISAIATALSQSKIVRHPKQPALEILARAAATQVLEKSEESFLNDLLGVRNRQHEACEITKQPVLQSIEKFEHCIFGARRLARSR